MKNLKEAYKILFPPSYIKYLAKELEGCDSILELGSGYDSPLQLIEKKQKRTGVELYIPYIQESMAKGIHDEYINKDVTKLKLKPKSYDAVIAIDLIEHLEKERGIELIKNMEIWARKKIIIYTPNGFIPQYDVDGNKLQEHLSGWTVDDFRERDFKIIGIHGLKRLRGDRASIKFKPKMLWRVISDLTQKITYHFPKAAFQIFAVKVVSKD